MSSQRSIHQFLVATALTVLSATSFAQSAVAVAASAAATPVIDHRQAHQEHRIEQGKANGTLTEREARRLERQQAHIERVEARAKADGVVTAKERRKIHHKQDRASKRIHRQKHDAQHQ